MRYKLIDAEKADVPVYRLCNFLTVSPSGYYVWRRRRPSQRDDMVHLAHIRAQFAMSNGVYGSPRMPAELKEDGLAIGRHRTARFMRDNGPKAQPKTRFKRTTDSNQDSPTASNLLEQDFTCNDIDQKWGVDISYVWTAEGWIYLAIVLNLFSRRIIGWPVSERMKKGLAMKVLQRAIALHLPSPGVIHHSDRRSQYCSGDYPTLLKQHGLLPSMSGKVNCHDNAMVETVFKTIKSEPI